jgi:hypothetical protein
MPKYVIEREIPGAGKMSPQDLRASQNPAACSGIWGRKFSGCKVTLRTTSFTASTLRRMKTSFASMHGALSGKSFQIKSVIDPTTAEG